MERRNSNLFSTSKNIDDQIFTTIPRILIHKHNFSIIEIEMKKLLMTIFPTFSDNNYRNSLFIMSFSYFLYFTFYMIDFFRIIQNFVYFEFSREKISRFRESIDDLGSIDQIFTTTSPYYNSHNFRSVIKIKIGADKLPISNLFSTSKKKIRRTKVERVSTISIDQISGPDSAQTFPRRSSNELRALRAIFIVTPTNNVPPVYRLSPMINRDRAIRAFDTRS